jgi:hypothetical protein
MAFIKRFSFAISILVGIALLMFLGTLGIKKMGEQLVKDSNGTINPQEVNRGLK